MLNHNNGFVSRWSRYTIVSTNQGSITVGGPDYEVIHQYSEGRLVSSTGVRCTGDYTRCTVCMKMIEHAQRQNQFMALDACFEVRFLLQDWMLCLNLFTADQSES